MGDKIKWAEVPQTADGFVKYEAIPSPLVRRMVADAEIVKLKEEHKARTKWDSSDYNKTRVHRLENRLLYLDRLLRSLDEADS